ncbi:unnamed protein product [Arctia plantaginis]|uniref:Uncharacterized protein n=1 Tax=Arctia plantaginis TaxID=874455 RepID=A0A8S0ZBS4_ARCPL|nr:unnamed protein product [Arctia plantaginis]
MSEYRSVARRAISGTGCNYREAQCLYILIPFTLAIVDCLDGEKNGWLEQMDLQLGQSFQSSVILRFSAFEMHWMG